jgi:hypothetical protein
MDPAEKKRILDTILKNAGQGEFGLDSVMQRDANPIKDIYKANNLQESAMGKLALEQFKGKVPNVRTNKNELQDFAEGLREQFTPDVKSKIEIAPGLDSYGSYSPKKDLIQLNPKRSATDFTADLLHEGLHSRDLKANDYGSIGSDLAPGKSLNMKLKSLAPELVDEVLGAAGAALLSQDAAAGVPLLNEAESIGESPEEESQLLAEIEAKKAYNKSPAKLARLQALMGRK